MATFLREENCTLEDFVLVLKRAHAEGVSGTESMGSLLVEAMSAVDDFESIAFFMRTGRTSREEDNVTAIAEGHGAGGIEDGIGSKRGSEPLPGGRGDEGTFRQGIADDDSKWGRK